MTETDTYARLILPPMGIAAQAHVQAGSTATDFIAADHSEAPETARDVQAFIAEHGGEESARAYVEARHRDLVRFLGRRYTSVPAEVLERGANEAVIMEVLAARLPAHPAKESAVHETALIYAQNTPSDWISEQASRTAEQEPLGPEPKPRITAATRAKIESLFVRDDVPANEWPNFYSVHDAYSHRERTAGRRPMDSRRFDRALRAAGIEVRADGYRIRANGRRASGTYLVGVRLAVPKAPAPERSYSHTPGWAPQTTFSLPAYPADLPRVESRMFCFAGPDDPLPCMCNAYDRKIHIHAYTRAEAAWVVETRGDAVSLLPARRAADGVSARDVLEGLLGLLSGWPGVDVKSFRASLDAREANDEWLAIALRLLEGQDSHRRQSLEQGLFTAVERGEAPTVLPAIYRLASGPWVDREALPEVRDQAYWRARVIGIAPPPDDPALSARAVESVS